MVSVRLIVHLPSTLTHAQITSAVCEPFLDWLSLTKAISFGMKFHRLFKLPLWDGLQMFGIVPIKDFLAFQINRAEGLKFYKHVIFH